MEELDQISIITPSPTPPSTLLLAPELLHLPPSSGLGFLQFRYPLQLLWTSLAWHCLVSSVGDQLVQAFKAGIDVIGLLSAVVCLDD